MKALYPTLAVAVGLLALTRLPGCAGMDEQALHEWMAGQGRQLRAITAEAPAPQPASSVSYVPAPKLDPFDARRLAGRPETHQAPIPMRNEASPESLASLPLSSLRMVGSLRREGAVMALIQAGARVYQVPVGARIGASRAEVLQISEAVVIVREGVPRPGSERAARTVTLQLQGR